MEVGEHLILARGQAALHVGGQLAGQLVKQRRALARLRVVNQQRQRLIELPVRHLRAQARKLMA